MASKAAMRYPYENFTNWVEDKVIFTSFDDIEEKDEFVKAVEKIRQYCYANKAGQNIYKSYFEMEPGTEVTDRNIDFRAGVKADKAWSKLIDREKAERERSGFAGELKVIDKLQTPADWARAYADTITRDDLKDKPRNKEILIKSLMEHPLAGQVAERKKRELQNRDIMIRITDAQQGEGRYRDWSQSEVEDEVRRLKTSSEFRRMSSVNKYRTGADYGIKMERLSRIPGKVPIGTIRSWGLDDRDDLKDYRLEKEDYKAVYDDTLARLPDYRVRTFEEKFKPTDDLFKGVKSKAELENLKEAMEAFRLS